MKAASLKELKSELGLLPPAKLVDVCMRLIKYKKENKELLTYLLFKATDELSYISEVKSLIDEQFEGMNKSNIYFCKKTIRKALRTINKFIKYSGSKQTEVELLIYFCNLIKDSGISWKTNTALSNLYQRMILRIKKVVSSLHEDLQHDYSKEINNIE